MKYNYLFNDRSLRMVIVINFESIVKAANEKSTILQNAKTQNKFKILISKKVFN